MRRMDQSTAEALAKCHALGLSPRPEPMGDDHHTEAAFSGSDQAMGDALAYFLGGLFVDVGERYFREEMTSVDAWQRVARALRVHGLVIANDPGAALPSGKVRCSECGQIISNA